MCVKKKRRGGKKVPAPFSFVAGARYDGRAPRKHASSEYMSTRRRKEEKRVNG